MFKHYYALTKPGIIYGNALTAIAGFLLASRSHINVTLLFAMLVGISLVIASACVFNNYIDRGIDQKMARTKRRALATGLIPVRSAIGYATVLGLVGFAILALGTNLLTVLVGFVGFFDYVVLYGLGKRRSVHGTVIGSIAGAVPPVAGYTAVTNHFDIGALLLFLILVFWQMPHFYAIAIYRLEDYTAAGLPVLPLKKGLRATKVHIVVYIIAFMLAVGGLTRWGYARVGFLIPVEAFALYWLWLGISGFRTVENNHWARRMFFVSLLIILVLCVALSVDAMLH